MSSSKVQSQSLPVKVAIQGIHGCFHEEAANKFFEQEFKTKDIGFLECERFEN